MSPLGRLTATIACLLLAMIALSAAAGLKERERCLVEHISDGDTVTCKILTPKAKKGKIVRVRLLGIDTLEVKHGSIGNDECHGPAAEKVIRKYVEKKVISLRSSIDSRSGERLARFIYVYSKQQRKWIDVGAQLLAQGHAVQFTRYHEIANAAKYNVLAAKARAARKNIWDPNKCGKGPAAKLTLHVTVGNTTNPNDEWVTITNVDTRAVNLGGWKIRKSLHIVEVTFPPSVVIPAGGSLRVYSGKGTNGDGKFYLRIGHKIWPRPMPNRHIKTAVYLKDRFGNFRFWHVY